jgi:hypothetical protein
MCARNVQSDKNYQLITDNDSLIFRTSSFRAEKASVLHTGVYTKEFASMLSASAVSALAYMVMNSIVEELKTATYITTIASFVAAFLGSRKFIFRDTCLEVNFNSTKRTVSIRRPGVLHSKTEELQFDAIRSVEISNKKFIPENMDGIDFVQKISAQHGSAVPGLSETEEFITLRLILTDGSERTIYAAKLNGGKVNGEPNIPVNEIRRFLEL